MTYEEKAVKLGKQLALAQINRNRAQDGRPLIKRVEKLWWRNYGQEFLDKAYVELALSSDESIEAIGGAK